MENAHKNDVNQVLDKMKMIKFQEVFMAAVNLLKKEPVMLLALFFAPLLVNALLESYVFPLILTPLATMPIVALVVSLLLQVVSALIGFFGFGLLVRAASKVYAGHKVDPQETVSFVQKHFVDAIKLAIKLFVYTGAWILIAYFLVAGLMTVVAPALAITLMALSPVAVIIYIVLFFKKMVNSSMSYAIFFSEEKPEVEGSLKRSLDLCESITWTLVGNYFLMGLVNAIISAIVVGILTAILVAVGTFGAALAAAVSSALVGTLGVLFQYCLKGQVEKFRGGHHA